MMNLAQINIGRLRAEIGAPEVADFIDNLDRVNAIAERSDGFIWRLKDGDGNATSYVLDDDALLIPNMSLWRDFESFQFFVFNTLHHAFLKRR